LKAWGHFFAKSPLTPHYHHGNTETVATIFVKDRSSPCVHFNFCSKLCLDEIQRERAHCMGYLTKAYHHQQQNFLALMSSYQQLNAAEKCGDIYEV